MSVLIKVLNIIFSSSNVNAVVSLSYHLRVLVIFTTLLERVLEAIVV